MQSRSGPTGASAEPAVPRRLIPAGGMSPSARRRRDCVRLKATVPRVRASGVGAVCGQMVLDAAFDVVLLDFKAADAGNRLSGHRVRPSRGTPARRLLGHVCGGELLRLDLGGFDDPGSAFALAPHEAREVGLRHAHRFATVFPKRGAQSRI
jgi:hypothetical protein